MRLDVLGRRRALWCSMRRWCCMLHAAAKHYVQLPPFVLVVLLLWVCVCVCVSLCVCAPCCLLRQALLKPNNPYVVVAADAMSSPKRRNVWHQSMAATSCV